MKRIITFAVVAILLAQQIWAQEAKEGLTFTRTVDLKATPVKDQYRAGTCWSYAGLALLESELIKTNRGEIDLSELYIVRMTYEEKAIKYVRMHGETNFGGGGAFHDVTNMIKKYGIVPEEIYTGLNYGTDNHVHGELDEVLKAYLDAIIKNKNRSLTTAWLPGFRAILDAYLGPVPEKFNYKGKEYTPQSYAKSLGLNMDDYICISSYTHHPFYAPFIIEIPDNWAWEVVYNLPLNEMMQVIDYSLNNGYTIGWASDVSEKGFSFSNGVAIIPETNIKAMDGLERAKWEKLSTKDLQKELFSFSKQVPEMIITQENRQLAFDNYETTDDHGMQITGIAKDQFGTKYYLVKNSWNTNNPYDGYFHASETFVKYKTMSIMVNKKALPKEILKKLNL
ncbi:MAG: C1 family peptidase [Bacteroidales bacterium]|nr:C1 family peptidase [Bacteroidales bacterium]MDY0215447.1 C1 family peptidase [Bacteroidales bacterium]